ncbi:MAG: disulfide bond formation protein DsbA [Parcubacteria group bacterium]|nr:disulfide bond formation protein DsbA [Parcubacteria group bacterium]
MNQDPALRQSIFVSVAILIAGGFVAGAILYNGAHSTGGSVAAGGQQAAPTTKPADISKVKTDGEPFIGKTDAPVVIAYWSDYQCPFCQRNEQQVIPEIIKNYVDTGKAKIVFKDYPFLGSDSVTGAEYGRSIWKLYPDQYFAWHTAMFTAQDAEGDTGFGNAASIDKLDATIQGLDAAKIKADVASNKAAYDAQVNADKAEGSAMGIQGTPGTIIGKMLIPGALPYSAFQDAIETALKNS